jgi:hypothetical protein
MKPMMIDRHPFPLANMVEINGLGNKGKAKISADELKSQSQYDQGQSSRGPRRTVTSQMLLNKYQCRQDRERRHQEERSQHDEDHWRCPFFAFCWNKGWRLPSADSCPKCNWSREDFHSSKRQCRDDRSHWPISRDGHKERCVPVHCRLGRRVSIHDWLEVMANDRVLDQEPLNHEIEHQRPYHYDPEKCP